MRVTIGERLGIKPSKDLQAVPRPITDDPVCDGRAPEFIQPESVLRLADLPSAKTVMFESIPEPIDDDGPPRVRGEMVWLHKTAPTLVIEGRPGLSPDDHAAGRRR
jgi:hypothetical protein